MGIVAMWKIDKVGDKYIDLYLERKSPIPIYTTQNIYKNVNIATITKYLL